MLASRGRRWRLFVAMLVSLGILIGSPAGAGALGVAAAADPQSEVGITKTNDTGGEPLEPGDEFIYTLNAQCSGLTVDCVNFTITDTLPEGFDVTSLPKSTSTRDVTYNEATRELTIVYKEPLQNPEGETGLHAGQSLAVEIGMRVPADTQFEDGTTVTNTAQVDADNADPKSSSTDVTISIPRVVKPVATKTWEDGSAVAGSGEESTMTLNVRNNSSSSAEVTELSVSDQTEETFEYFDFESASVTAFPEGADQAHIVVTTADGQTHEGATITAPGELPLPAGVDPGDVVGFEVVFTNSDGDPLPYDENGGTVEVQMQLRDTYRSTGEPLRPTDRITVNNCATPAAQETTEGEVEGEQACDTYDILPDILVMNGTKSFYPDTDGDYKQETGEHAVLGENSPVSMGVDVTNESPFPVKSVTITEPSAQGDSEFEKVDVDQVRLRFPEGATEAHLVVTYDDGSTFEQDYTENTTVDIAEPGKTVTKIEVTYTGVDEDGNPTIAEGSTAGLDMHGTLNDGVTAADLSGGTSPGIDNCAAFKGDAGRTDGSGTASGDACKTLPIEEPNTSGTGTKSSSQQDIPDDQPVDMTLHFTNNGNKPLVDPVLTDPPFGPDGEPDPAYDNPFDYVQINSVTVSPSDAPVTIEVWDPTTGEWVAYDDASPEVLERAKGVRASYDGEMAPQTSFTVTINVERREGVENDITFENCFTIDAGGDFEPGEPVCSPGMTTGPAESSASLNKSISPGELPEYVPGLPRQHADMTLTVANTGNMSAKYLRMTDQDSDFFDAVDLVGIKSNQMPAGANRVQIDAYVNGAWVNGTPSDTAALPAGVNAADVTGIRVTYSSTSTANDGYVIKPHCTDTGCQGILTLDVSPRQTLRSNGEPVPSHLEDTVSGEFLTKVESEDNPKPIDPVTATLDLVKGDPVLDVEKTEDTVLAPGEDAPFYLQVTNTGTANVPNLVVKDDLPEGIEFVDTFQGDNGEPYKIINESVPDGTPPVPTPEFTETTSDGRVSGLTWDFSQDENGEPWVLAPGATFTIEIHVRLEAGIRAGDVVTNTMGATSSDPDFACEEDEEAQTGGPFGDGLYCVDPATLTAKSGAAFTARKWVSGNDSLGWYNTRTEEVVPVGDDSCLSTTDAAGRMYTANPCIALVNPGDEYHYLMRIQNSGTESGTNMRIVDRFPVQGDKGVILNQQRGTAWDKRPTLASQPELDGPGAMNVSYENSEPLCTDDLNMGGAGSSAEQCPSTTWDDPYSPQAVGAKFDLTFAPELEPGGTVNISWAMDTPLDVTKNGDPTIAWNSYAHNETTDRPDGASRTAQLDAATGRDRVAAGPIPPPREHTRTARERVHQAARVLQPNEPIQVGVALGYGDLKLVKRIGNAPDQIRNGLERVPFPFHVRCVIRPQGNLPRVVLDKDYRVTAKKPVTIEGLPAGAECEVWETSARGGQTNHPESDPVEVTIEPGFGTPAVETARITNDFEFGELDLVKVLEGDAASYAADRKFGVEVACALPDEAGNPTGHHLRKTYEVGAGEPVTIRPLPVNTQCWAQETGTGGAAQATVDHDSPENPVVVTADGTEGGPATITATNTFPAGALTVSKEVVNGGEGPYDFALTCTTGQGEVALAPEDAAFGLSDGEQRTISVPDGAECTVTETAPSGATVTYGASDGGDDGTVTVDGSASVDITNTFDEDAPGDGHGPGVAPGETGGDLPFTGLGDWKLLGLLAVALALAGTAAYLITRRRRSAG